MTLTIPQAGPIAGRAAQIRVEATDTGSLLAQAGQVAQQIGSRMEADRLDRQAQKLQLDATRELGQMRLEFEQNTDPDAIDTQWPQRVAELKDRYLKGRDENGMARVDPRIADRFGMAVTELADRHAFALGSRAIDLRRAQREAIWMGQRQEIVTQGATTDDGTRAALLAQGDASIEALGLDDEQKALKKAEMRYSVFSQRADALIASDPQAFLAQAGPGSDMENALGEDVTAKKLAAQTEITRRAALTETERKRLEGERIKAAESVLKDGIAVLRTGSPFARAAEVDALLADPAIAGLAVAAEYANARALQTYMPDYAVQPLAEKQRRLAEERARPKDKGYEAGLVTAMEGAIAAHETAITSGNIYAYAASVTGRPVAPLPAPDASDQDLMQAFYNRRAEAAGLEAAGLTGTRQTADGRTVARPAPLFSPEEREVWATQAAPDAAPADRARAARLLATAFGADAGRAIAELAGDKTFVHVGGGLAAGALTETTARQTFEGQRAIDRQDLALPPLAQRRGAFFASFNFMFADGTGPDGVDQTTARDSMIASADAYYAWLMRNEKPTESGVIDEAKYKQALHVVMGGTGAYDDSDATGGVQNLRSADGDYAVFMPPGVNAGDVQGAIVNVLRRMQPENKPRGVAPPKGMTADDWAAISATGTVPDLGGETPTLTTLQNLRLRAVGGTAYDVYIPDPADTGLDIRLKDAKGAPWQIDMGKLLRAYGPGAAP